MGTIKALCISEKKGTLKTPVHKALFQTEWGMVGDAHAGRWHRQVSFLGLAEIEAFRKRGIDVKLGAFGENIVAEGFRFKDLPVGTRLRAGEVWFEITQIGKECHKSCAIRSQVGDRGIALVVTTGGTGFSVRDVTPEATLAVCERLAPGIPEAMCALSMQVTHRAMLSRAQAGIYKRTLIVNLPGSRKAVEECLGFVLPEFLHGIEILRGDAGECARK